MTKDEFKALVKWAEQGRADAIAEIRKVMQGDRETWRPFGDLTEHVMLLYLDLMFEGNVVAREAHRLTVDELREGLRQVPTSPVRQLVVEQIILGWLDVHYQQTLAAGPHDVKSEADFLDRRLAKSQKRYLSTLETLARMDQLTGSEAR